MVVGRLNGWLDGWMIYQVESSFIACHTYTGVILSHNEAFWVILTAHSLDRYHAREIEWGIMGLEDK